MEWLSQLSREMKEEMMNEMESRLKKSYIIVLKFLYDAILMKNVRFKEN